MGPEVTKLKLKQKPEPACRLWSCSNPAVVVLRSNSHRDTANLYSVTGCTYKGYTAWKPLCQVGHQGAIPSAVLQCCLHGIPVVGKLIKRSTWIFDWQCGTFTARFRGTGRLLQSYFAVAQIIILLCIFIINMKRPLENIPNISVQNVKKELVL